jgi:hypothetical protein
VFELRALSCAAIFGIIHNTQKRKVHMRLTIIMNAVSEAWFEDTPIIFVIQPSG